MPTILSTPRPPLLGYRRLRAVAVALLVVEFVVGMAGHLTPRKEIFPLASWFLFLLVPNRTIDYDLILRSHGNVPIDPPLPYSQVPWLVATPHSIVTYQLVQQLGDAQVRHDAAHVRSLRRQLDSQFWVVHVQYDLVRNTYLPVERWETGRVRERQELQSFTSGEP